MPTAFINYRRSDSAQAAQGLYAQLIARFGPSNVFLDVSAILPGSKWPDRLRSSLEEADVLLLVIGPRWLTAANQYGQRRLDDEQDWVRKEIAFAISKKKPIIPLLVAGATDLPPRDVLPVDIRELPYRQFWELRDDKWDHDLTVIFKLLESTYGFTDNQVDVVLPGPEKQNAIALTNSELELALVSLPGWQSVESILPRNYPKPRQELRKIFRFNTFKSAIAFMEKAVPKINELKHHPRWENQWKTVTVYLSTWDIGNRISAADTQLAAELDKLYLKHVKARRERV